MGLQNRDLPQPKAFSLTTDELLSATLRTEGRENPITKQETRHFAEELHDQVVSREEQNHVRFREVKV